MLQNETHGYRELPSIFAPCSLLVAGKGTVLVSKCLRNCSTWGCRYALHQCRVPRGSPESRGLTLSPSRCHPAAHGPPGTTEWDAKRKGIWKLAANKYLPDVLVPVIDIAKLLRSPRAQIRHKHLLLCEPLRLAGNGLRQQVGILLAVKAWLWKVICFPCEESKKHEHAVGCVRNLLPSGKESCAAPCVQ